jgi:hypothetical protein
MTDQPFDAFADLLLCFGLTGGGYALGTWLGKTIAAVLGRDRTTWGDWGGIFSGLFGLGLFFGYFFVKVIA